MSPGTSRVRAALRIAGVLALAAVILASCTPAKVAVVELKGTPALSISVPLSTVSCTLNDVCLTVGTSSNGLGPTSVAEFSTPRGHWFNLSLPTTASTLLSTVACSGSQCLIGGSRPGRDLLWGFSSHGDVLTPQSPPPGGIGVSALSCSHLVCALIDNTSSGLPRFSVSADDGTSWSSPVPMAWAKGDAVTALACGSPISCAVGVLSLSHEFSLYVTPDGGATWTLQATPLSWTTLNSLSCDGKRCVALAATSSASFIVHTKNFTRTWTTLRLSARANALACSSTTHCIVAGQRSSSAWLATVHDRIATNVRLRYVPTPLLKVACGSKVCAAIGVTTLLSVPVTS